MTRCKLCGCLMHVEEDNFEDTCPDCSSEPAPDMVRETLDRR